MHASGPAVDAVSRAYPYYVRAFQSFVDAGRAEQAARFIAALRDFWWARHWCREGLDWAVRVLALPDLSELARATVLDHAAALAFADGQHKLARGRLEASLALRQGCGSPREIALTLNHFAAILRWGIQDIQTAQATYFRSLSAAARAADRQLIAAGIMPLGPMALDSGDIDGADALPGASRMSDARSPNL